MSQPHYSGDLQRESIAELLLKVYNYRVPGIIEARLDDVTKVLYVLDGNVVYARSSAISDRLNRYLLDEGLLSVDQIEEIRVERDRSNERAGVLMMRRRMLSPQQLRQAIQSQIELIAWSLFSWKKGTVTFRIEEPKISNTIRIQIPLRSMIFSGLKENAPLEAVCERLGGMQTVFEPQWVGEELIDIGLDQREFDLLLRVDGQTPLERILHDGTVEREQDLRLIHAFHHMQLIAPVETADSKSRILKVRLETAGGRY